MIPLTIALIVTGAACAVFAIIATFAIQANNRLERSLEEALAGKEHLKAENGTLLHNEAVMQAQIDGLKVALKAEVERLQRESTFKQKTIDHLSVKVDEIRAQNRDLEEINSDLLKAQVAMRAQLAEQRKTVPIKRLRKTDTSGGEQQP